MGSAEVQGTSEDFLFIFSDLSFALKKPNKEEITSNHHWKCSTLMRWDAKSIKNGNVSQWITHFLPAVELFCALDSSVLSWQLLCHREMIWQGRTEGDTFLKMCFKQTQVGEIDLQTGIFLYKKRKEGGGFSGIFCLGKMVILHCSH